MAKKKKIFKESVGLDIGSHSIKLVHLKRVGPGFKLLGYSVKPTIAEGIDYTPSDLLPTRFAPILAGMLKELKINPKKIKRLVSSIGGDNTSIKQIKTIFLPEEELESALFFEAKKHLPISGAEMILDYQVLNVEEKTNNMNILLAAATRTLINDHSNILTSAGMIPEIIDLEPLALSNCFTLNNLVEDGVYIMLNIGAHKTNMVIYGPEAKFFSRDFNIGGYYITKDIMKLEKLSFEEAEKYKFEAGVGALKKKTGAKSDAMFSLDVSEKTVIEQLALELKRSIRFYVKEAGTSDFRKVYLMGGTAKLIGLPEFLEKELNIPVEIFTAYDNIQLTGEFKNNPDPQFAVAIGLAMRPE
jgi:type IV pilus assembly protein PilM